MSEPIDVLVIVIHPERAPELRRIHNTIDAFTDAIGTNGMVNIRLGHGYRAYVASEFDLADRPEHPNMQATLIATTLSPSGKNFVPQGTVLITSRWIAPGVPVVESGNAVNDGEVNKLMKCLKAEKSFMVFWTWRGNS
jgi:hypothetical protein